MRTTDETPGAESRGCNRVNAEGTESDHQQEVGTMATVATSDEGDTAQWLDARNVEYRAAQINDLDVLTVDCLEGVLERLARNQGKHFRVVSTPRWNAEGEPIGPDVRIDPASAEVLIRVVERVGDVLREELDASLVAVERAKRCRPRVARGRWPYSDPGCCTTWFVTATGSPPCAGRAVPR